MTELEETTPDQKIEQLESWLSNICYDDMYLYMTKRIMPDGNMLRIMYSFCTNDNKYNIVASPEEKNGGYIDCTMSKCDPYPGEERTHDKDLAGGNFSEETFETIKSVIIRTELKTLFASKIM